MCVFLEKKTLLSTQEKTVTKKSLRQKANNAFYHEVVDLNASSLSKAAGVFLKRAGVREAPWGLASRPIRSESPSAPQAAGPSDK